jgi:hypothetical protein
LALELVLELVLEFDLDIADSERPLPVVVSAISSSLCAHTADPNSSSTGERRASLICCRPSALRSAGREDTEMGESVLRAAPVELVFVFGFDSLL